MIVMLHFTDGKSVHITVPDGTQVLHLEETQAKFMGEPSPSFSIEFEESKDGIIMYYPPGLMKR